VDIGVSAHASFDNNPAKLKNKLTRDFLTSHFLNLHLNVYLGVVIIPTILTSLRKKSPTSKREGEPAPVKVGDEFRLGVA